MDIAFLPFYCFISCFAWFTARPGEPTNRQGRMGAVSAIWEGTTVPGNGQGSSTFPQSQGFDGTCGSEKAGNRQHLFCFYVVRRTWCVFIGRVRSNGGGLKGLELLTFSQISRALREKSLNLIHIKFKLIHIFEIATLLTWKACDVHFEAVNKTCKLKETNGKHYPFMNNKILISWYGIQLTWENMGRRKYIAR